MGYVVLKYFTNTITSLYHKCRAVLHSVALKSDQGTFSKVGQTCIGSI